MKTQQPDSVLVQTSSSINEYCTFWLGGRFFGVDILSVKEINNESNFTKIYHAPNEVRGYVNIRGQIYLVIDMRLLLGMKKIETTSDSRIMIFKEKVGESCAILVDKIGDVVEFDSSRIEDPQKINESSTSNLSQRLEKMTTGICRLDKKLLVILNPDTFLLEIEKLAKN